MSSNEDYEKLKKLRAIDQIIITLKDQLRSYREPDDNGEVLSNEWLKGFESCIGWTEFWKDN